MDFLSQILTEGWKLWLIIGILFFVAEGLNAGTFALFFGGLGALTTALVCRLSPAVTGSGTQQLLIFAAMSLFSLFCLRSRIMRFIQGDLRLDGPQAFLGRQARVLSVLRRNGPETGWALFEGTEWAAVPSEDAPEEIPPGSVVEVVKMEGLTLRVRPVDIQNRAPAVTNQESMF
ncbi:MAG: NfeD family protein, partial [Synergistaceae bacterium]|jgi:membrane protein implicated in regulation of membrane protease activity|nr:NfeD family protein [Synergistaceae bacterium]